MKRHFIIGISLVVFLSSACTDREAEARKTKEAAEARARADAACKEMNTLPNKFQTPDYFKKNEPEKKTEPASDPKKSNP